MIQVRAAERDQKIFEKKTQSSITIVKDENLGSKTVEISRKSETVHDLCETEEIDEAVEEHVEPMETIEEIELIEEVNEEPVIKKSKSASLHCIPASITYTHFELHHYKENGQKVIVLNITADYLERPADGKAYQFDSSWISHADSSSIYKCKLCVKAFANAEFLLKHMISSHLCLLCLTTVDNYKELTSHSKSHSSFLCAFCSKSCTSPSQYRQHLKKQHMFQLPNHIGILLTADQ